MKTTLVTVSLLLTALAILPGASAAPADPCETTSLGCDAVTLQCTPVSVGLSCVYSTDWTNCLEVQWGVHSPAATVGGDHTCHVEASVPPPHAQTAAGAPCDVSPTWPGGYAACTVAGKEVGCSYWTGALLEVRPDMVSCGTGLSSTSDVGGPCTVEPAAARVTCTPQAFCLNDFHTDGFLRVWSQGCTVGVQVVPGPLGDLLDAVATPCHGSGPTEPTDVTCTTDAGTCTLFLNRWSYGGCQTVLPCSRELRAEFDRYTVEASSCRVAFGIVG